MKLNCKDIGNDSCTSRFIAMAACSFAYGVAESDKSFKEVVILLKSFLPYLCAEME